MYKYTSEELYSRAEEDAAIVDRDEWESWVNHPCGKALKHKIMGDQVSFYEGWVNDQMESEESKWLLRESQLLMEYIFEEGICRKEEKEDSEEN